MSFTLLLLDLKIQNEDLSYADTRTFADVLRAVLADRGIECSYMPVMSNNIGLRLETERYSEGTITQLVEEMMVVNDISWTRESKDLSVKFLLEAKGDTDRLQQKLAFFGHQLRMGYPDMGPDEFSGNFDIKITGGRTMQITCKQPSPDIVHLQNVIAQQAKKIKLGELEIIGPL